jgi:hypothetical protein
MKYLFFWGVIISSFCFYTYNENQNWREEMVLKYGYVYVTEYGEKYHTSYHYHNKNHRITMLEAYERGKDNCSVCDSPIMANFSKEKDKLPWYQIHWFIALVLITVGHVFVCFKYEESKTN